MKVNLIIPSFYPATIYGGPIFSTFSICKELIKLDNIQIYVSTTNANMTKHLNVEINKYIELEDNFFVKYYNDTIINTISLPLLFHIFKDIKNSDIVHIQSIFSISTPISLFFSKKYNKPIFLSPRGQLGEWCLGTRGKLKRQWLKYFIRPFSRNVTWHATAEKEKDEILSIFFDAKVEVIPNGIFVNDYKQYNNFSRGEYLKKYTKFNDDCVNKVIVSLGRLHKKKGFDILIEAFNKIVPIHPNSYLLIAGPDEGEKQNLIKLISNLRLNNKVFLIGNIEDQDKIDFLANADLFVLPSHNENFGNVYLESLAAGTPVVASKNTPWEGVEPHNCGIWAENTVDRITNAMMEVLDKDRDTMRRNSMIFASGYDWANIAIKFKNTFERMINEKS